ncbi:hypothetical protein CC79DRAFT_1320706 [Sarocladium strictum]
MVCSWLYLIEIKCLAVGTKGGTVTTATNWITNFIFGEVTPVGVWTIGRRFYNIRGFLNASFIRIIWLFYAETANHTLEDPDAKYRENPPVIVIRDEEPIPRKRPAKYAQMQRQDIENAAARLKKRASLTGETRVSNEDSVRIYAGI